MSDIYDYQGRKLDVGTVINITGTDPDKLLFTDLIYTIPRSLFWGDYRFNGLAYDSNNDEFYMVGGSVDRDGSSKLIKFADVRNPLNNATVVTLQTGHSNDICYEPVTERLLVAGGISKDDGAAENTYSNTLFIIDPSNMAVESSKTFQNPVQGVAATGTSIYVWCVSSGTYYIYEYDTALTNIISSGTLTKADLVSFLGVKEPDALYAQNITYDITGGKLFWNLSYRDENSSGFANFQNALMVEIETTAYNVIGSTSIDVSDTEEFQGSLFVDDCLYLVSDGKYGTFRLYNAKIQNSGVRKWIAAGTDLNTIYSPGEYFSNNAANSATLLHTPVTGGGFNLTVSIQGSDNRRQVIVSNSGNVYQRIYTYLDDSWSNWSQ